MGWAGRTGEPRETEAGAGVRGCGQSGRRGSGRKKSSGLWPVSPNWTRMKDRYFLEAFALPEALRTASREKRESQRTG